jgi:hypothetical protein
LFLPALRAVQGVVNVGRGKSICKRLIGQRRERIDAAASAANANGHQSAGLTLRCLEQFRQHTADQVRRWPPVGGALCEEFVYDARGEPLCTTLAYYALPNAGDVPPVEILLTEDAPSPLNPLGIKSVGEGGITGVGAALAAAIDDALGIPGAVTQLPATPQRIRTILRAARDRKGGMTLLTLLDAPTLATYTALPRRRIARRLQLAIP